MVDMIAVQAAIDVLNEALEADPVAIQNLMACRVLVNTDKLTDHPTIQVGSDDRDGSDEMWLRPLGLINGLFGVDSDDWGYICMAVDEFNNITKFGVTPGR